MELLKHRCPNKYKEFEAGDFSFLKTNKQFSRMALDLLREQNYKYIKSASGATSLINRQDIEKKKKNDRMTLHWLNRNCADQKFVG